ncbi:site-specific DNA-methyltransferase [Caenispirillum bisanense]|uniref:site-specific DNA-methyltransferase (adenine-specific) n=1 Tax=Caenispirillum bisanense TaxID=414052 RepID=A0A286GIC6_9PROT|nr:site-specific DNA-methyltransferase [Caenispirillum bisanense]SOD95278.1 adenine-specific DNA-methyltransferase [Caenispirillum bisanense]
MVLVKPPALKVAERRKHYESLNKQQLVDLLERRDGIRPLTLVWEREHLKEDLGITEAFPALRLEPDLSCGTAPWRNLVIEGDNHPALRHMLAAWRGKVKCILIDPPYNTGNKDWVYNDRFVGKTDRFRQSLWLEFLYQRLLLARELLTDDGVILVCMSDENRSKLELLMDQVFPNMRVGSLVWRSRIGGNDKADHFLSVNHEHVLVYGGPKFRFGGTEKTFDKYVFDDGDGKGPWRLDNLTQPKDMTERRNSYFPLQDPATGIWYPCNPNAVWRHVMASEGKRKQRVKTKTMDQLLDEGAIVFPSEDRVETWATKDALLAAIDSGDVPWRANAPMLRRDLPDLDFWVGKPVGWGSPQIKRYKKDLHHQTQPLSSWIRYAKDPAAEDDDVTEITAPMTEEGTKLINALFGEKTFNYPKPPSLIKALLQQVTDEDSLVVDVFAGSGTTGHAVLALNAEDGGNRRFILVSNTEATRAAPRRNICRDVCAERLRRVIAGYEVQKKTRKVGVPGLPGDFAYLRLDAVGYGDVPYDLADSDVWTSIQLLHDLPLRPFDEDAPFQQGGDELTRIVFAPRTTPAVVDRIRALAATTPLVVWARVPGPILDAVDPQRVTVRAVPADLMQEIPE